MCRDAAHVHFTDAIQLNPDAARAEARVFVDPASEYLRDHFPGTPVLPGLVMLQVAVCSAAALLGGRAGTAADADLEVLERLQVVRRVVPGETLCIHTTLVERSSDGRSGVFTADGRVGAESAMRARFRVRTLKAWSNE